MLYHQLSIYFTKYYSYRSYRYYIFCAALPRGLQL